MSAFGIEIDPRCIRLFEKNTSKQQALDALIDTIAKVGAVTDPKALHDAILAREQIMSTGIGSGVAVPHVRIEAVTQPTLAIGISPEGIPFDASDNQPVTVTVLFAMPPDTNKLYLGLLAQVMVALKNQNFLERLLTSKDTQEIATMLNESA